MSELQPTEILCIPKRRRLVHDRLQEAGREVLHIFYGEKEIIFDEPELLSFGDKLIETESFRAEEAMAWSSGAPHDWPKVREMLEALLDNEILARVAELPPVQSSRKYPETLGDGPLAREPRTFSAARDECRAITQEAFGHSIELSSLEAVVPVYRVAHAALDEEGRQLGENNVTPRGLFLDRPTERRTCKYSGSRHHSDLPMNITALRQMTKRWPELLSLTEQFRRAYLARGPQRGPVLCAGDAHLLTVGILAAVGYVMVRGVNPIANGALDAGLAGMFRLSDGVRLVTTEVTRATAGHHACDTPLDAQQVADYAERNSSYEGVYGVCAGPPALIDEYLSVLLDGASAPIQIEPTLAERVGDLGAAIEYGLHGQRIESLMRAFGASQGLLHLQLRAALGRNLAGSKLRELLDQPIDSAHYPLLRETHPLAEMYALELQVSRWLFTRAGMSLSDSAQGELERFLPSVPTAADAPRFAEFLSRVAPEHGSMSDSERETLATVAVTGFALERECIRAVTREQQRLNERLQRASGTPLRSADLAVYNRARTGPVLAATLAEGLGLSIRTDAVATLIMRNGQSLILGEEER
jgi:hypothetical protein